MINVSSKYEDGVYEPSIDTLIRLSEIYGVSINYLLFGKDKSLIFNEKEIYIMSKFLEI